MATLDVVEIALARGRGVAIVDHQDGVRIGCRRWYATGHGYAYAVLQPKPKQKNVLMHRLVMDAPPEFEVDHINGDKLDNRRCNLRLATRRQNAANTRARTKESALKGVYPDREGRWRAAIKDGDKQVCLGSYANKEEAALVYDGAARIVFGRFARLNFPTEGDDNGSA